MKSQIEIGLVQFSPNELKIELPKLEKRTLSI